MTKKNLAKILISIIIVVLSFITLNQGLLIDENGLLSIYKGIYQGQRMFVDNREPIMMGGVLTYPLFAIYYNVVEALIPTCGVVLFFRVAYMLFRLIISIYLFFSFRRIGFEKGAWAASTIYYMYIIGWKSFSYKSMCDFAIALIICFAINYIVTRKNIYMILMGVALSFGIVAYPSLLILAAAIGVVLIYEIYRGNVEIKSLIILVCTCIVCGTLFLIYLHLTAGLGNVISQLQYIEDSDYDDLTLVRYGKMFGSYAGFAFVAYLPVLYVWIVRKFRDFSERSESILLTLYWIAFFVGLCGVRISSISTSRFVYACLLIYFWFPYLCRERNNNEYTIIGAYKGIETRTAVLWLMFMVSTVVQITWAVTTNQNISIPAHMSLYAVMAVILLIAESEEMQRGLEIAVIVVSAFFMGFWVPDGDGGYNNVLEERFLVEKGALKGVYLSEADYHQNELVRDMLDENVISEEYLFVAFGPNSTAYLNSDAKQSTCSVYARPQENNNILRYWEEYPELQANYVLIDEACAKYEKYLGTECEKYITEHYTNEVARAESFVLLAR